jgi:hypothetical protein
MVRSIMRTLPLLTLLLLANNLVADEAKGSFHFGKTTFKITNAIAYQRESADPKKPVTIVLAADFKIDLPAAVASIEPANALLEQVAKNQGGNFVLLRLAVPNRCGITAFLDTGKQADLGDTFPAKTIAATPSRITGECSTAKPEKTLFDDPYDFHIAYDVPITPIAKPTPLAAGGGEPGHAFVALIDAIRSHDWDATHVHLRDEESPKTKPPSSEMKRYFEGLALNYPKSATVTGGVMKGDSAQLEISGITYDGRKIKGDIAMRKAAGNWRVFDMSLYGE